jgi:regulator of protease activity HflC (stomatin/prohibitin superfamily)
MDQFRPREDPNPVREIERGLEDLRILVSQFFRGKGVWLGALALLALYLASGFYVVGTGEKGIVLLFGNPGALSGFRILRSGYG